MSEGALALLMGRVSWSSDALLNGYVGALAIRACQRLGLLELLQQGASVNQLARHAGSKEDRVAALVRVLTVLGLVSITGRGAFQLTARGREVVADAGYFVALVGGYGRVLTDMADLMRLEPQAIEDARDVAAIAEGCAANRVFQKPILESVTRGLRFQRVADLGCGSGQRLMELCGTAESTTGLGIDSSPQALRLAATAIRQSGLSERIELRELDVREVVSGRLPPFEGVDLVSCFFLLHHLLRSDATALAFLVGLRRAFPDLRFLLVADGFRIPRDLEWAPPVFSLGYELVHGLMDAPIIADASRYERWFESGGFRVRQRAAFGHPLEFIFVLSPR